MNFNYEDYIRYMEKIGKSIDDYSIWNYKISFDYLAEEVNKFMDLDLPLYSFGSADGKFEKYYNDNFLTPKIICVDPDPTKFHRHYPVVLEPEYSTVEELINSNPKIVENSQALLIWVSPNLNYDIDVIKKLKPKKLLVLWDSTGSAGSQEFHEYIGNNDEYISKKICSIDHDRGNPFIGPCWNCYEITSFERRI